jgi:TonB family protein
MKIPDPVLRAGLLVLAVWGQAPQAGSQGVARLMSQPPMSPGEVANAEAQVQASPEDLNLRWRLLTYYRDTAPIPPSDDPGARLARLRHIQYIVEHFPSQIDPASPLVYVFRSGGAYADSGDHEAVRAQWMRAAEANSADSRVVLNAALFLFVEDKGGAVGLLKRALEADPGNQRVAANLGFLYAMEILGLDSFSGEVAAPMPPAERTAAVEQAKTDLETCSRAAILAGAATAIPNLAMHARRGQAVDPELFELSSRLMARARSLAPSDEAFRGPMPMIQYFEETQGLSGRGMSLRQAPELGTPLPGARIRIGGSVQKTKFLSGPQPNYPEPARNSGIEGDVRFQAVIGRDGNVLELTALSGHPLLVAAALDAVKQWRYRPTLLNGDPVEVVTEIVVSFPPK